MFSSVWQCRVSRHWRRVSVAILRRLTTTAVITRSKAWYPRSPQLLLLGRNTLQHVCLLHSIRLPALSAAATVRHSSLHRHPTDSTSWHRQSSQMVALPCYLYFYFDPWSNKHVISFDFFYLYRNMYPFLLFIIICVFLLLFHCHLEPSDWPCHMAL